MRLALLAPCPVVRNNWRCALDPARTWDLPDQESACPPQQVALTKSRGSALGEELRGREGVLVMQPAQH